MLLGVQRKSSFDDIESWKIDAHLHIFTLALKGLHFYKSNLVSVIPLHPTCLIESNIQLIFNGDGEHSTPLSLSVNVLLALGTFNYELLHANEQFLVSLCHTHTHAIHCSSTHCLCCVLQVL